MKKRPKFEIERCVYKDGNPVYLYGLIDPYTAKMAKFLYEKLHLTANKTTILAFTLGFSGIAVMYFYQTYLGLIIAAILITLRNFADTIDGKIARGTNSLSPLGGYSDIVTDWLFFHAAFFIVLGLMTNHIILGFLCVTGYMSREFSRRKFTEKYGVKITETKEAEKMPFIVSLIRKYDLAAWFLIIPIVLLIKPVFIIYFTVIVEYGLLFGELIINYRILIKDNQRIWKELRESLNKEETLNEMINIK
ncbi:MAG: CDP-alcohol phosphatidyltransferase family protein [Nanoarchaeota archaeon]